MAARKTRKAMIAGAGTSGRKALRLHGTIARDIGLQIVSGNLRPGNVLDGEVEASEQRRVSRTAYREAVRILSAKGLVHSRPRVGTRVSAVEEWHLLDPDVLSWAFIAEPAPEVLHGAVRVAQHRRAGGRGAGGHAPQEYHLDRMRRALDAMAKHTLATDEGRIADKEFHAALLPATGNPFIVSLTKASPPRSTRSRNSSCASRRSSVMPRRITGACTTRWRPRTPSGRALRWPSSSAWPSWTRRPSSGPSRRAAFRASARSPDTPARRRRARESKRRCACSRLTPGSQAVRQRKYATGGDHSSRGRTALPYPVLSLRNTARGVIAEAHRQFDRPWRIPGVQRRRAAGRAGRPRRRGTARARRLTCPDHPPQHVREFSAPDSPPLDFVFTLSDTAAGEAPPMWPGHPITAHWHCDDPAKYDDPIEKRQALIRTRAELERRLRVFANLPVKSLDRMSLQAQVEALGQRAGTTDGSVRYMPAHVSLRDTVRARRRC